MQGVSVLHLILFPRNSQSKGRKDGAGDGYDFTEMENKVDNHVGERVGKQTVSAG